MTISEIIAQGVVQAVQELYGAEIQADDITMTKTRKEFAGDYTVVVFPFARIARKRPEAIGAEIGPYLVEHVPEIAAFNVVQGFLNLEVATEFWSQTLQDIYREEAYGVQPSNGQKVMVEFSSPNTNKPLHLGHIRNILLGWSTAKILEAAGYAVTKVQIINDRGIAICKSMLAWQKFADGATPESTGSKSDHFVGKYYVLFEQKFREEYQQWQASPQGQAVFAEWTKNEKAVKKAEKAIAEAREKAVKEGKKIEEEDYSLSSYFFKSVYKNTYFNEYSDLGREAKAMLLKWEAGDPETLALWKKMNNWVYAGFAETYAKLGVEFDKLYYESDTYLLGKDTIEQGLVQQIFYQKADGSVWIDLEDAKLDHKLVLRKDGTSVYMTQDIGTAQLRYEDFGVDKMVYVVADEQNYHFQVLFEVLKRLQAPYADGLHHLSYGMVDLPDGKMKSREGTVVDADDLIAEVTAEARAGTEERDTIAGLSESEREDIIHKLALAALKFFIIKVFPQKRMTFDPKESVDFRGQTGPYIQNAYVRIQSVIRNAAEQQVGKLAATYGSLAPAEQELVTQVYDFPELIKTAAENYDPSAVANYCYDLAKNYHRFYHDHSILSAESEAARDFRLMLSMVVSRVLKKGMEMLGIEMPDKM